MLKQIFIITLTISFCFMLPRSSMTSASPNADGEAIIADHSIVRMVMDNLIPEEDIANARNNLHIAYEHTSHGSQITTGMDGLNDFKSSRWGIDGMYNWTDGIEEYKENIGA